jgi:hypothetical protein
MVFEAAEKYFGSEMVRYDEYRQKGEIHDFPVSTRDGRIVSSINLSEVLKKLPILAIDYVFIAPEKKKEAKVWLEKNREKIIKPAMEEEE